MDVRRYNLSMAFTESWWSICLRVPAGEAGAMSRNEVLLTLLIDDVRGVRLGASFGEGPSPRTWLSFDLRARGPDDALGYAQSLVANARKAGGLAADPLEVEWVAGVPDAPDGGIRFFEQAQELFDNEMYEMAVVAAHIHFELQISYLLKQAHERRRYRWADRLLRQRGSANLARDFGQAVIELLLGVDANQVEQWEPFITHTRRRNAVVHAGAVVGREEAAASLEAVHALWMVLSRAAQAKG